MKQLAAGTSAYLLAGVATVATLDWHFGGGPTGVDAIPFVVLWPDVLVVLVWKYLEFALGFA